MSTADGVVLGTPQIFGTAPRNQAFNVVLLAEGFTNPQQNDFNAACSAFVTALTGTDPFRPGGSWTQCLPRQRRIERVRCRRSGQRGRHRHNSQHLFRCPVRSEQSSATAGVRRVDRPPGRHRPGAGILGRAGRRELRDLRRERRTSWRFLARAGGDRIRPVRDGPAPSRELGDEYAITPRRRAGSRPAAPNGLSEPNVTSTPTVRGQVEPGEVAGSGSSTMSNWTAGRPTTRPSPERPDVAPSRARAAGILRASTAGGTRGRCRIPRGDRFSDLAPDFDEFCALLTAHAVAFVIVGAGGTGLPRCAAFRGRS